MTDPRTEPRWLRLNWGVATVLLLAVNILADLTLGRHGITGIEAAALAILWAAFWLLAALTVVAALVRSRRAKHGP